MKKDLIKLLENEEFVDKILKMETYESAKDEFKSKGVELTEKEFSEIKDTYGKVTETLKKLDDDTLEQLSGGGLGLFGGDNNNGGNGKPPQPTLQEAKNTALTLLWQAAPGFVGKILGFVDAKTEESRANTEALRRSNNSNMGVILGTAAGTVALTVIARKIWKQRKSKSKN